jgi:hypothetical protein
LNQYGKKQQLACIECDEIFDSSDELDTHNNQAHGSMSHGQSGGNKSDSDSNSDYWSGSGGERTSRESTDSRDPIGNYGNKGKSRDLMGSGHSGATKSTERLPEPKQQRHSW